MKNIKNYKGQVGATLLEMVMVVGIIAVISIAAISYYNSVNNGNKIKDEVNNLNSLSSAIKNMFNTQGDYEGLNNNAIISSSTFPDRMRVRNSPNLIKSSWKNDGVVVRAVQMLDTPNDGFTVTYSEVPQKACFDFVQQTSRHYYIKKASPGVQWNKGNDRVQTIADVQAVCNQPTNSITFTTR